MLKYVLCIECYFMKTDEINFFRYGHLTWEWQGDSPLRSPLYHLIFVAAFHILKFFNLDHPFLIVLFSFINIYN